MESFGHIFVCINNNVVMSSVLSVHQFYVVNYVFKGHLYMFRHTKVFITKVNLTVEGVTDTTILSNSTFCCTSTAKI